MRHAPLLAALALAAAAPAAAEDERAPPAGRDVTVWLELSRPVPLPDWTFEDVEAQVAASQRGRRVTKRVTGNWAAIRLLPGRQTLFVLGGGGLYRELVVDADALATDRISLAFDPARVVVVARPPSGADPDAAHRWTLTGRSGETIALDESGPRLSVDLPGGFYRIAVETRTAIGEANVSAVFGAAQEAVVEMRPRESAR